MRNRIYKKSLVGGIILILLTGLVLPAISAIKIENKQLTIQPNDSAKSMD